MLTLLFALACASDKDGTTPSSDSGGTEETGETGETGETEPEGTDEDGDGWSVEEGDCDDASIYVNPAWDEDTGDGVDNDCDGRIDEVWTGFSVVWLNGDEGGGTLLTIDTLGALADEQTLDSSCAILGMDRNVDGLTVVNNNGAFATLDDGACTELGDFSELDFGLAAVGALPDGTMLALTADALWEVESDGELTSLASWSADYTDATTFERYGYAMAVNATTGEVGIADYFGGFVTWSAEGGLVELLAGDLEAPVVIPSALTARDGGGWLALATSGSTGAIGLYDVDGSGWALRTLWEDTTRTPYGITTEGGSQDAYVTSNAGQRGRVWRVRYETGEQGTLYESDTEANWYFTAILTDYQ